MTGVQHSACMIEAFKRDGPVYHVVKRCRNDCPVLINSTAQHIRCCFKDACNDLITIGITASFTSLSLDYTGASINDVKQALSI